MAMQRLCVLGGATYSLVATAIGAALAGALIGCGGDGSDDAVAFRNLRDGDFVGGLQVTALEIHSAQRAVRAELYLDGLRIAFDELAPFDLAWDAAAFTEGQHELAAVVELDGGAKLDGDVTVRVDNTSPVLTSVPATAEVGKPFAITATDNGRVARVELSRGRAGEPPQVLMAPAFSWTWEWGCGSTPVEVTAIDAAGGATTQTVMVNATNLQDRDCDAHLAFEFGGDDCNDSDAEVYPGNAERGDLVDRNCNGLEGAFDGIDNDHDGVLSAESGGNDCDDANPNVFGAFLAYNNYTLGLSGTALTWSPGQLVLTENGSVVLDRKGVIEQVVFGAANAQLMTIGDRANDGALAVAGFGVAYGRGNDVVRVEILVDGTVTSTTLFAADAPVGRLAYTSDGFNHYVVFEAGAAVWLAANNGNGWSKTLLADTGAALAEPPALVHASFTVYATFRTSRTAYFAERLQGGSISVQQLDRGAPTAVGGIADSAVLVAVAQGDGGAVLEYPRGTTVLALPARITRLHAAYPYLYVQTADGALHLYDMAKAYRPGPPLLGLHAFEAAYNMYTFAGDGHFYSRDTRSKPLGADEIDRDGVDSNCDGSDD